MRIQFTQTDFADERYRWSVYNADSYDGAEDSTNRETIGYGPTPAEALNDLHDKLWEKAK